ncbi:LuxR C-terminal-related transcriptional regulator [Actinomadura madurae]|uniref:helix-turn-helix transcriptional regulator n=1 Tax=Actinomadura madurae TaxID=1993 RepID=UPI000D97EB11|nr:LuxR family transcriptional regulator [Actinomadura madurae]SPT58557.1 Predicted transcriptional regulator [Actinomadura madurae]
MSDSPLLEGLGVTAAEETAYRGLLREGPSTLAGLAARLGTSAAAVRRLLPRLEELGLVTRLAGRPLRLLATPPHVAVEALVASRQEEIARTRAAIGPLLAEAAPHPEELVEVVSGRAAVARRYLQLLQGAREELIVLVHPPFATDVTVSSEEQERTMRRGIRVRGIYGPEAFGEPGALDRVRRAVASGEQARLGAVPIKLAIADGRTAMLPLTSEHASSVDSSLIVHPSALLDALVSLFEALWRGALPLPGEDAPDDAVLTLLAAGLTDDAIARRLSISTRTVQRRVRDLCDRLGARTRFQAGALYTHHLDP